MASGTSTIIGRGAHVRGRVSGAVDLEIHGRVDGDVAVEGEVTIDGLVGANVSARRIVARGAVKGDLTAEDAIVLEDGARVVGDLRAPRIAIGSGALVRGYVQTGDAPSGTSRAKTHAAARPQSRATAAPAPARQPAARAAEPAKKPAAPAPRTTTLTAHSPKAAPPPPVVPVLKKGAKGTLKKKAG
jgi:cytoskeletal protein CcmA (bactofilin family)